MTDRQIDAMVSDLVQHVDYDVWKGIFSRHPEDPEVAEDTRAELREVARRHLEKDAAKAEKPGRARRG